MGLFMKTPKIYWAFSGKHPGFVVIQITRD